MTKKMNSKIKVIISTAIFSLTMLATGGAVQAATEPSVSYNTHVQNVGWQDYVGMDEVSGTEGKSYRLEGIKIKLDAGSYDLGIQYQTHIQNIGWENEVGRGLKTSNQFSGTEGLSYRLEGIKINLTGADADKFDILYRTHIQNVGWETKWKRNGEMSGTSGKSYRLEGIIIKIVPKGSVPVVDPSIIDPLMPTRWDANKNGVIDPNEQTVFDEIYTRFYEVGPLISNPDYVAWKVNLPYNLDFEAQNEYSPSTTKSHYLQLNNFGRKHLWSAHYAIEKVNGINMYEIHYGHNYVDITQAYKNDVANGCVYNYVEWLHGNGNSQYPNGGVSEGASTMWNITENRYATHDEGWWAHNHEYIDFYYCHICGETSLGNE